MMTLDGHDDRLLLHALADGELDAATALVLERRLEVEPELAKEYDGIMAVKAATARVGRPVVTDAFAARIAALATPKATTVAKPPRPQRWAESDWRRMAASIVVAACLGSGLTYAVIGTQTADTTEDEVVGGHRRSLLAASPIDIASSDRHTVRPWLDAKLGLSPPTPDLAALGFPLVGGRVDVVAGRPVPSLVYRHKEHQITVVAIPRRAGQIAVVPPVTKTTGGYNLVRWSDASFSYWAVSDLDAPALAEFVDDLRSR